MPASTPQSWIARCAGVQNVSRPMERCQEMSHWPPIMAEVTAKTEHQTYQGTRSTAERTSTDARVAEEIEVVVDAMLSLCTFLIIALFPGFGEFRRGLSLGFKVLRRRALSVFRGPLDALDHDSLHRCPLPL